MALQPLLTEPTIRILAALSPRRWMRMADLGEAAKVDVIMIVPVLARLEFWGWAEQLTVEEAGSNLTKVRLTPTGEAGARASLGRAPERPDERGQLEAWTLATRVPFFAGLRFALVDPKAARRVTKWVPINGD